MIMGATGGSTTLYDEVEDSLDVFNLVTFQTCSIYCLKYLIWRKIQIPI